nr:hypothetical protein Datr000072 [Darna trima granulovirus]
MIDPDNVRRLLNDIPNSTIFSQPAQMVMFKNLKHLWCNRSYHCYSLLEHFVNSLDHNELPEFVSKLYTIKKPTPKLTPIYVETVPPLFVSLNNCDYNSILTISMEQIIDTLGRYCTIDTKHVMCSVACVLFKKQLLNDKYMFLVKLREELLRVNLLSTIPLRDDVCYRYTKLCNKILLQIRGVV